MSAAIGIFGALAAAQIDGRLPQPSWQAVIIIAVIGLTLAAIGYGGTRALRAIGTTAYQQGSAPKAPESFNEFFLQSARIAIVAVIVMATVVLALFDKLDKGAIGVLSGVAGYVLGGASRSKKAPKTRESSTEAKRN